MMTVTQVNPKERKKQAEYEFAIEPVIKLYKNKISYFFCSFRIKELINNIKDVGDPIIDIGCQQCFVTEMIQNKNKKIFGLDLSFNALLNRINNLSVIQADAFNIPIKDNSCNVICSDILEHVGNYRRVISELIRVAKKDIVLTIPFQKIGNFMRFFALFVNPKLYKNRFHHPLSINDIKKELNKYNVDYKVNKYPNKFFLMGYLITIKKNQK